MDFLKCFSRGSIDLSAFVISGLQYHLYVVDDKGNILYGNEILAKSLGVKSDELLSIDTFELVTKKEADKVKYHNEQVLKYQKKLICTEHFTFKDQATRTAVSIKSPLVDLDNEREGVIGISLIYDNKFGITNSNGDPLLTKRQYDCLYYLVKGCSIKEIASHLEISPRTAEHHIENIKRILNCSRRSELITHALRIEKITQRLFEES